MFLVALVSIPLGVGTKMIMPSFLGSFVVVAVITWIIVLLVSYALGLSHNERAFINNKIQTVVKKIIH